MKKLIALLSFALLTGCGTLSLSQTSDIRMTVRLATVLYINDNQERAEDVLFVVEETRRDLNSLESVSISKVADFVRENILWQELTPLEAVAAEGLINRLELAIQNEIREAELPADKLVLVRNVLDWIEDAIVRVQYQQQNY
jgi:outer membrane lipopolysaccharide assembly protein LptE/RlpB